MNDKQIAAAKSAECKQNKADTLLAGDVQTCLGDDEGRRLLAHLKDTFEVGLPVFVPSNRRKLEDPLTDAATRDGNHEVVRYLEEILNLSYLTK